MYKYINDKDFLRIRQITFANLDFSQVNKAITLIKASLSRKNKIKDYTIYDILETASKINLPKKNINIEKKSQPIDYNIYLGN